MEKKIFMKGKMCLYRKNIDKKENIFIKKKQCL